MASTSLTRTARLCYPPLSRFDTKSSMSHRQRDIDGLLKAQLEQTANAKIAAMAAKSNFGNTEITKLKDEKS